MVRKRGAFDLNRCTIRQLVQLSGIPLTHAEKLVRFRERQLKRARLMDKEGIKLRLQRELSRKKLIKLSGSRVSPRQTERVFVATSGVEEDAPRLRSGRREVRFSSQRRKTQSQPDQNMALELSPGSAQLCGAESQRLLLSLGEDDSHQHSGRARLGTQGNPFVIVLEFKSPTDCLHHAVGPRSNVEDPSSSRVELEEAQAHCSVPEPFLHTENQQGQEGPRDLALKDLAQPEQPDPLSHRAEGSPEPVPPPRPALLTQQGPSHPHLVLPKAAYRPKTVPCQADREAGFRQWIKCKICGALERCWSRFRHRYTQRRHCTAQFLQNGKISVEVNQCMRRRRWRRKEKRGEKLMNRIDVEVTEMEWDRPGQEGGVSSQQCTIQ